jgi:putative serine protease PepD
VRGVEDGSPAARAGIREGDLIVAVAGRPVSDADALFEILAATTLPFEVTIVRGTEERTVAAGSATEASGEA